MDATLDERGDSARPRDPTPLERGDLLGRYVVLGRVGQGGMGAVYAAYDPELDRKLAIKLLHSGGDEMSSGSMSGGPKRLMREAQALAKLSHANVVTVHDVGEHRGHVFVAMEFIAGRTVSGWIAEERPRWREVLDVYLRAGRGLAAIHSADLVHRDFKPDNVMVGGDGRVLVMDLGLARRVGERPDDAAILESRMRPAMEVLATPMTQAGAILGTPAYMAPEQHLGLATTARSDQFSFCVALFEGLYRQRPFHGDSVASLAVAVTSGRVAQPTGRTSVPGSIRRAILRGLRADDGERWPDMTALLDALERALATSRRRPWVVAGGGTIALVAVVASVYEREDPCGGGEARLAGVWDAARRDELRDTFVGLGALGPAAAERVVPMLDDYAVGFASAHRDTCEATEVRREQSVETRELRLACLSERLRELDALVGVLVAADAGVAERAVEAAESLPTLERCGDVESLRARVAPPDDPGVAARVEELRDALANGRALEHSGKYEAALAVVEPVVAEAETVGYRPLLAEASLSLGNLQQSLGAIDVAERAFERAYFSAEAAGDDELALLAALHAADVLAEERARFDPAEDWLEHAAAKAERLGDDGWRGEVLTSRGGLLQARGDYPAARAALEQSLELLRGAGRSRLEIAETLGRIGIVCETMRELACAREKYTEALEIRREAFGEDHPRIAEMLDSLAIISGVQGDLAESKRMHEQAIAIWERTLGADSPAVAVGNANLGQTLRMMGELEAAREALERAQRIWESTLGPRHPNVAKALIALGSTLSGMGEYDRAIANYDRAIEILRESVGTEHDVVGAALTNQASAMHAAGRPTEAREKARAAVAIFAKRLGENHPNTAMALFIVVAAGAELEQFGDALADAERLRAMQVATSGEDGADALSTDGFVSGVLWEVGRRDEAVRRADAVRRAAEKGVELAPYAIATAWQVHALDLRRAGREAEAIVAGERALEHVRDKDPSAFADIAFALARAMPRKDRDRAVAIAREGLAAFVNAKRDRSPAAERMRKWLASHGDR